MRSREAPLWLRILLNLCGPVGVGLALLGYINAALGLAFLFSGVLYVGWEIYPSAKNFVGRRRWLSLPVFLVSGLVLGLCAWLLLLRAIPADSHDGAVSPSEAVPSLVARVLIARADPLVRFYQHPPVSFERVNTELYVELTNQTDAPIYIQGYSVLALIRGQQWRAFQNLPGLGLESDEIGFLEQHRAYLARIDLSKNGFDWLIRKGPIGAHQAIQAWMFFKSGLSTSEIFQVTQFRITLIDSTEKQYVLFSDYPNASSSFAVGELKVLPREPVPTNLREEP